ncbi:NleF caspase inhibitor [Pectobacterium carotovorum]|uniref:Type III effector n=1 Tax=Pectobacterium carotovorum TaxID=554 RepID=A0A419ASX1_PECCA|nr:NleF caspase inhibitor [Pectobacterium carotovorum]RJL49131.1 type III effector [Pectobacterium carotovorum]
MINSISSSINSLFQHNSGASSRASVSELNEKHIPNNDQRNLINNIVDRYANSSNKIDREKIAEDIKKIVDDLMDARGKVFELVNENTAHVYGKLRRGKNENDRDVYIGKLNTLFELRDEIKNVKEYKGFSDCKVDDSLHFHHSSRIYGDLKALSTVREGRLGHVPDLVYNRGDVQFG